LNGHVITRYRACVTLRYTYVYGLHDWGTSRIKEYVLRCMTPHTGHMRVSRDQNVAGWTHGSPAVMTNGATEDFTTNNFKNWALDLEGWTNIL